MWISSIQHPVSSFQPKVYNLPIIKFCILKRTTTFAAYLVPASSGIKREVRCDSGAIPVAVSSFRESFHDRPVGSSNHCSAFRGMGRYPNRERVRRPATYKPIIHGFRVKSMEFKLSSAAAIYLSPFFYFPGSSLFKPKTNQQ